MTAEPTIPERVSEPADVPTARRSRTGLTAVALLAVAIAAYSLYQYASASLEDLAETGAGLGQNYVDAPAFVQAALYTHIGLGSVALVVGPAQFVAKLRARAPRVHRVLGRVYLIAVLIAATAGLVIAPFNAAGLVGLFGFGTLAILWLVTALRAYRAIRRRDIRSHQAWMIRNYALTFAAPTLRFWVSVLILVQVALSGGDLDAEVAFANAYAAVPFLCWLPNLVVAEWLIRRRGLPSYRLEGPRKGRPLAPA